MRKIILICTLAVLMVACKTTSITNTSTDKKSQVAIKGNWVISAVTFGGSQYFKVNSFQIADSECFEGSTWKFISNNNKGEMALTKAGCTAFSSPITWFVNKEGQFVLKILDAGIKAKKVRDGYILSVANQTESSFQLIDRVDIGGKMTEVVYQFQKVN